MKYHRLGRTGLKVSEFCLGCMTFGGQAGEQESRRIIERAWDAGVNFFDTADVYSETRSESTLGEALRGRRGASVIATKVYGRVGPYPNDAGLSRKHILEGVENSLRRLQTDYIDLYQVHEWDPETPIEETIRALDDLVHQGKVRYVGCSNFAAWQLCKALWSSDVHNLARFECVQPRYNLIHRQIEQELLPLCAAEGVGVIVYNPLAGGLLSGKHTKGKPPSPGTRFALREQYRQRYWHDWNFDAVEQLKAICQQYGKSLVPLAIAWVLANPTVTSAIVGASLASQVEEALRAVDVTLSQEEMEACNRLWDSLRGQPAA